MSNESKQDEVNDAPFEGAPYGETPSEGAPSEGAPSDKMWVVISDSEMEVRGDGAQELSVVQLSQNVQKFLQQVRDVLGSAPVSVGQFELQEVEVSAEISGEGQLMLLGSGGKAGAKGGLKFVFRQPGTGPQ